MIIRKIYKRITNLQMQQGHSTDFYYNGFDSTVVINTSKRNNYILMYYVCTVELQWLERLWDHGNLF